MCIHQPGVRQCRFTTKGTARQQLLCVHRVVAALHCGDHNTHVCGADCDCQQLQSKRGPSHLASRCRSAAVQSGQAPAHQQGAQAQLHQASASEHTQQSEDAVFVDAVSNATRSLPLARNQAPHLDRSLRAQVVRHGLCHLCLQLRGSVSAGWLCRAASHEDRKRPPQCGYTLSTPTASTAWWPRCGLVCFATWPANGAATLSVRKPMLLLGAQKELCVCVCVLMLLLNGLCGDQGVECGTVLRRR